MLKFSVVKERGRYRLRYGRAGTSRIASPEERILFKEVERLTRLLEDSNAQFSQYDHAIKCRRHFVSALRSHWRMVRLMTRLVAIVRQFARNDRDWATVIELNEMQELIRDAAVRFKRCRRDTGVTDLNAANITATENDE